METQGPRIPRRLASHSDPDGAQALGCAAHLRDRIGGRAPRTVSPHDDIRDSPGPLLGVNKMHKPLTAIIEREGDGYVSLCPELDIASQGNSIEEARENLREALELFFETASPKEIETRLHEEVYVTRLEIAVG